MRIRTPIDLGLVIRARRKLLGVDQRDLADRVGVSRQWIVAIEQGKAGAEVGLVLRTLHELGLELDAASPERTERPRAARRGVADIDAVVERARKRT